MSTLTPKDRRLLDDLFAGLRYIHNGVIGSYGATKLRNCPTVIVRGGRVILLGEEKWLRLWVICPRHAFMLEADTWEPIIDQGVAIMVGEKDDGPWWDFVHEEIPKMEEELRASQREKDRERARALELAARSFGEPE